MKKLLLISLLIPVSFLLAQSHPFNYQLTFTSLKGVDDINNETNLFYTKGAVYYDHLSDTYENSIYDECLYRYRFTISFRLRL